MKKNSLRQIVTSVILILADIALIIVLVKLLRWPLIDIIGFDICDYEGRDDVVQGFRVYRFGAGCFEYLFVLLKAAVLIVLEKITYKRCKGPRVFFIIAIILHVILLLLCIAYVYRFLDGNNIFWLLRYFLTGEEAPF
ncbi:MAG: hypothetical protein IK115_10205 [Lachnospiraceae bacterium]|nr:hypothetical protein [Lachnospiraceae bacterium]